MPPIVDSLFFANVLLLILAFIVAIIMSAASVRYRRHIGDILTQNIHKRTVLYSILILIIIGLTASALNLIFS